jgi:transcriptional regulator with XRE-family HTH domain
LTRSRASWERQGQVERGTAYRQGVPPSTALGAYLRARRALVRPEDVGLPGSGRRRVPGLRREELAMLAGISSDYYLRLEQGRNQHPSAQVIDALARALRLDEPATAYLHAISQPPRPGRRRRVRERPSRSVELLIASLPDMPAFIQGRHLDVLAANAMASALAPTILTPGVNLVRATFMDPAVRELRGDWESLARGVVARLRGLVGADVDNPRLAELVDELSASSEDFRRLWARHDVDLPAIPSRTFRHPVVGPMQLMVETLAITDAEGQFLVVNHAEPGSPSELALTRLSRIAAGDHLRDASKRPGRRVLKER